MRYNMGMMLFTLEEVKPSRSLPLQYGISWPCSSNKSIAETWANTKEEAIEKLQEHASVSLNENGYAKNGEISYCVAEVFGSDR